MIIKKVTVGSLETNCYILVDELNKQASPAGRQAIIIDPGDEAEKIKRVLSQLEAEPALVINTHGHVDHVRADDEFGLPVYVHEKDAAMLTDPEANLSNLLASGFSSSSKVIKLKEGQEIKLGEILLEVIHTPGHTPGGISLLLKKPKEGIVFTGDSLFFQGIGRTDFPGANHRLLLESIKKKLFTLADDTVIYPGHGAASTIGFEKKSQGLY